MRICCRAFAALSRGQCRLQRANRSKVKEGVRMYETIRASLNVEVGVEKRDTYQSKRIQASFNTDEASKKLKIWRMRGALQHG